MVLRRKSTSANCKPAASPSRSPAKAQTDTKGAKPVRSCLQRSYGPGSAGLAQILGAALTYNVEKPSELGMYRMDSRIQSLAESDG